MSKPGKSDMSGQERNLSVGRLHRVVVFVIVLLHSFSIFFVSQHSE